ncbi:unnamed protein product [Gongylonema pulchrum]|uniref:Uncharacterized protein n=1 Tax=Gongylonema pulchrum TaxID=637853 RepID=A0A3P6Q4U6_9BILA|nr:unnamed protein product [Gongylonema pulchrum]
MDTVAAKSMSSCGPQPVVLTASIGGGCGTPGGRKAPMSNSVTVNYQPKRVPDHSSCLPQAPAEAATVESAPVFQTHLPPPQPQGLVPTGEQLAQHQPRNFNYVSSSSSGGAANPPVQQVFVSTAPPKRNRMDWQNPPMNMPSQDHHIAAQNTKMLATAGGRQRTGGLSSIPQVPVVGTETNLPRRSSYGVNGDILAQLTPCVDTKRLELAMKGSGTCIKSTTRIAQSLLPSFSPETTTLRDLLMATAGAHSKVITTSNRTHYISVINDGGHRYAPYAIPVASE